MKKNTGMDFILIGLTVVIGLAESAHLAAVVLGWTFSRCALLFGVAALLTVVVLGGIYCYVASVRRREKRLCQSTAGKKTNHGTVFILRGVFAALMISQIAFIFLGPGVFRQGDMTVETVGSFLAEDAVYAVNPMTGQPYAVGLPMRLKILCLPSLYGFLCNLTGASPLPLVQMGVPIVVLLCAYVAFAALGRTLFAEDKDKRACFLVFVSVLFWVGAYAYGMDGFNVLCCGWRGVTLRNVVLLPWLISLVLRKKWFCSILCILAEACVVWTLYGMGVGLLLAIGMLFAGICCKQFMSGAENKPAGKEEAK